MGIAHQTVREPKSRFRKPPQETPGVGHNAGNLKEYSLRIESQDAEIAERNADKSAIYGEAKGAGFDVKVLRKVIAYRRSKERQGGAAVADAEVLFDEYLSEIEGGPSRVHAREADAQIIEPGSTTAEDHKPQSVEAKLPAPIPEPIHPKPKDAGPAPAFLLREGVTQ